jgi:DNA-binding transcriptional MerR regulator
VAKGPEAFRTISEAAEELGVPQHVLRFWETRFSFIRPMKRAGGRRFYRPQDIQILRAVQTLLHGEGYTIKGVQRLHREQGVKRLLAAPSDVAVVVGETVAANPRTGDAAREGPEPGHELGPKLGDDGRERLIEALDGLLDAKQRLDSLLRGR